MRLCEGKMKKREKRYGNLPIKGKRVIVCPQRGAEVIRSMDTSAKVW
jgi:hypothetical protein